MSEPRAATGALAASGEGVAEISFHSRTDPRLGVEVLDLAEILAVAHEGYARHDFSMLVAPLDAPVNLEVDFRPVAVEPGAVLHVGRDQVHRWTDRTVGRATVLLVRREVAELWALDPEPWDAAASLVALDGPGQQLLGTMLRAVADAQTAFDGSDHARRVMDLLVGAIATQLRAARRSVPARRHGDLTTRFLTVVAADARLRSVEQVAAALGYSARHIGRVVSAETGRTAGAWLRDRTMLEAKRLLAHTDLTAASIGRRLGFVDASHFSRAFTRQTGQTTTAFRTAAATAPWPLRTGDA